MSKRNFSILIILLLAVITGFSGVNVADAGPGGGTYYASSPAGFRTGPSGTYWTGKAIRKFVHTLPGLGSGNPNDLGQYIAVANPDTGTFSGSDYYEIGLRDYTQLLHSDLAKATKLRGYYQINGTDHTNTYLGPVIIASKDRPVRIKFVNNLGVGAAGNLFIPVDTTAMGAGLGPDGVNRYTQNRATLHLHGGNTPWISDGTPHQWVTPAGENTTIYTKGASQVNVPGMPNPGAGAATFFYTNQQSGRLMFYHDHAYGITRLNVYAGEAAGYLLYDQVERDLIEGTNVSGANPSLASAIPNQGQAFGGVYHFGIPLIIQDKTFVPTDVAIQDALWNQDSNGVARSWRAVGGDPGDLWFPHVYEPNQLPDDPTGANPFGRWDYGPWFWPPVIVAPQFSTLPEPSMVPEAFMDTPIVNGTPYPKLQVTQTAYRFRILNASNDRAWNFQLYYVDPLNPTEVKMVQASPPTLPTVACASNAAINPVTGLPLPVGCWPATWPIDGRAGGVPDPATAGPKIIQIGTEGGLLPAPVEIPAQPVGYLYDRRNIVVLNVSDKALFLQPAERADIIVDFSQVPAGSKLILYSDAPAPVPGFDPRIDYYTGNPDYTSTGGAPSTIAGYGPNTRTIMQFEVLAGSGVAFNLSALQAAQPVAFATSQPAPIVPQSTYSAPYNAPTDTYAKIQDFSLTFKQLTPISGAQALRSVTVTNGGTGYSSAPSVTFVGGGCGTTPTGTATVAGGAVTGVALINAGGTGCTSLPTVGFTGGGGTLAAAVADFETLTLPMQTKAIQELWDPYGRMNATLGVEFPFTSNLNQTTIPLGYIDFPTEIIPDGQVQLWKITHNGVDTHPVHFHLFNVQLINRVGWDGAIRPPDANEIGWKETVRMSPLEDAIVALRAKKQTGLPFTMPTSQRVSDVTTAQGAPVTLITDPFASQGSAVTVNNPVLDFSWEYVWHCHILGHEENDFMRAMILEVPTAVPPAPSVLTLDAATAANAITLNWGYPSYNVGVAQPGLAQAFPNEPSGFLIERCTGAGCSNYAPITTIFPSERSSTAPYAPSYITTYADTKVAPNRAYGYRVTAINAFGNATPITAGATSASYASVTGLTLAKSPVATTYNLGTAVTITPTPTFSAGAAVTPQFRFWVSNGVTNVMVQDYGVASTYILPASTLIGTYLVTADARTNLSSQTPDFTSAPLSVVIALPTLPTSTLTITKAGTGSGTVTSSVLGIACGVTCSSAFTSGSSTNIIATADASSSFIGFSGACIGASPCTILMDAPKAVTATFTLKADFSGTPLSGANPLAVQFTDHSIAGASSWQWDFGDSTTSTLQSPDHVYATSAGYPVNYSVSLTANGATTTKTNYISLTSSCSSSPVLVGVTPYATIQNALDSALSLNDIIRVMAVGRTETLNWNQNIAIGLYGGYDCNFTTNSLGFTTVTGSMTIDSNSGTLTIENLTVK